MTWVDQAVTGAAAYGLLGSRTELPDTKPDAGQFTDLLRRLQSHRILGLAARAAAEGALPLTADQESAVHEAHAQAMAGCLLLEATLLDVQAELRRHGVRPRVIKGPAAAHLDYPDPGLRCFGDLDLLVRGEEIDRATATLRELGYGRSAPEPRPGFDARFGKGATFVAADGTNVDLHRTFVMGPLGLRIDLDELWSARDGFPLAGERVETLCPEHRLLAACYNAIIGDRSPRLATLRDIAQLSLGGQVDADATVASADRWGAQGVLARGVRAAWQALDIADVVALSAWAGRYQARDDDRVIGVYQDEDAGYAGLSWATARMLPMRDRMAFLTALAFPRGGRLGKRGWGLGERLRRAARGYRGRW